MPFMHSESAEMLEIAMYLFDHPGMEDSYNYELKRKEVIDRFGRYPYRNQVLKQQSIPEKKFLAGPRLNF